MFLPKKRHKCEKPEAFRGSGKISYFPKRFPMKISVPGRLWETAAGSVFSAARFLREAEKYRNCGLLRDVFKSLWKDV